MEIANAKSVTWSEEKLQQLQAHLTGIWAQDDWPLTHKTRRETRTYFLHFRFASPSLKVEFKYAIWYQFESGYRRREQSQNFLCAGIHLLAEWLNQVAPTASSLLERNLKAWEDSLRTFLMETKRFRPGRKKKLRSTQSYVEYPIDDRRIHLLHTVYRIIADAYDERAETDKDVWDMRKLGLSLNLSKSKYLLNFEPITQPWLRHLAKEFMKYSLAIRSTEDSYLRLSVFRDFSRFLTQYFPQFRASDIDRTVILKYLSILQEQKAANTQQRYLSVLRTFFDTCAHRLHAPELTREPLIFEDDFVKVPLSLSREIPEEVQVQLREHLHSLPTTTLRMVTILLECGLRIHELCSLPLDCLIHDDKHEWYLCFYQTKSHKDHIIPLVNEKLIGAIQAQQQEIREQRGDACPYLFPSPRFPQRPYRQSSFTDHLNRWAVKHDIRDHMGNLYRFTSHQFRHTLSMQLIDEDVPLEVISRLLGHSSLIMTQVYARVRDKKMRTVLERVNRKRKTVDAQGQAVKGDPRANDPDAQMTRKGMRGQTLPVGGCGRLIVLGECSHANKCLTCPMWLTSTEDLPALKSFYERAIRLKQRAIETENQFVLEQQNRIVANLVLRIKSLEASETGDSLSVTEMLAQLQTDLAEAENALEEVRENGLIPPAKYLERSIADLRARITALEDPA